MGMNPPELPLHWMQCPVSAVTIVRERIERRLGVETEAGPLGGRWPGMWAISFRAPADVDLDFLRPDVLPPRS